MFYENDLHGAVRIVEWIVHPEGIFCSALIKSMTIITPEVTDAFGSSFNSLHLMGTFSLHESAVIRCKALEKLNMCTSMIYPLNNKILVIFCYHFSIRYICFIIVCMFFNYINCVLSIVGNVIILNSIIHNTQVNHTFHIQITWN